MSAATLDWLGRLAASVGMGTFALLAVWSFVLMGRIWSEPGKRK